MPRIPLVTPPEPDELMISYLWRLAEHNGFQHVSDLLQGFIWPNRKTGIYQRQRIRVDANNVFPAFYDAVDLPIDPVRFYLDHTIYGGLAPLMTSGVQMQVIAHAFHYKDELRELMSVNNLFDRLYVCPCCQKEDLKRIGFWYYHREHHMAGVTVCAKHKTPLHMQKYATERKRKSSEIVPFKEKAEYVPIKASNPDWAIKYAVFANDLLNAEIDCDVSVLNETLLKKLKNTGLYDDFDALRRMIKESGCSALQNTDIESLIKSRIHGETAASRETMLSLAAMLYKDVSEMAGEIVSINGNTEQTLHFFDMSQTEYNIIGKFYKPLLEMQVRSTGERFLTTTTGFLSGFREISADDDKTAEEKYREMFDLVSDESYHMLSSYSGMGRKITVHHDLCNKSYSISARSFLIDGNRCICERSYTRKEAEDIVGRHKGFRLIEYPIGKHKPCRILHEYCGNEFETTLSAFTKTPLCRRCETIKNHSEQNIDQLVKDLTGDEYTVVSTDGYAKGKITLRHNVCGHLHTYISRSFTEGARCPRCRNCAKEENFREYIRETSGNKYKIGSKIGDDKSQRYEIINTETKEVLILTRRRIMQEFERPTPSPVLPLEKKYPSKALMTHQNLIWEYLTQRYKPDDYIVSTEIAHIEGVPDASLPVEIGLLISRKRRLFRVFDGYNVIYAFRDVKLSSEESSELLFVRRNGVRFGFKRGLSLGFELGIIKEKPEYTQIASNVFYGKPARKISGGGMNARVGGAPVLITDNNYRVLQFIDLCSSKRYYGWENAERRILDFAESHDIKQKDVIMYLDYYTQTTQKAVLKILEKFI